MDTTRLTDKLYKSIDVWRKHSNKCAIRYRCFQVVGEKKFCVQSADYFYYPIDKEQIENFESQFLQLFIDCLPDERTETYATLEEAIKKHEEEFMKDSGTPTTN